MNTVILKETAAPADSFTVIGVGNPAQPQRLGYIDSADARSLPVRTLIPVFINYGVSNAYGKRKVVNCINQTHIIIAQDTTVRMYRINGNSLVYVNSLRINGGFGNIHDLLPLNDTLLGIRTYNNEILFLAVSLSATAFPTVRDSIAYVGTFGWGDYKRYYMYHHRPYFHGIVNNNLYISTDYYYENYDWMRTPMYGHTYGHYLDVRNILFKKSNKITAMPYSDAFNTGNLLSQAKILCTNGFPFPFEIFSSYTFLPGNVSTEIFAADVGDQRPRATDSAFNAIYRDDVHKQNQLQNILLDTTNRRVYLMFNNNMTILGYQYQTVGVAGRAEKPVAARGIFVLSNAFSSGVTIVLPAGTASTPADLYFYDLAGRVVDKLLGVTSKAILWRPKTRTMSCYLVMAKIGGKKFTEKFMAR
ncbi:MAG: hypothetical protein JW768_00270 [Chitinispirillaceae bacterium]|nr:hypothetical protein [Chitinispirillaceae bacterium]